jgi:rhodanese-related sulfurtransferase
MSASHGNAKRRASKADNHIVVMCHHGVRSLTVTNWLRQQGYEKVQSMRGGIDGWARTVDPKVPLY